MTLFPVITRLSKIKVTLLNAVFVVLLLQAACTAPEDTPASIPTIPSAVACALDTKPLEILAESLKKHEGKRTVVYREGPNKLLAGYGHLLVGTEKTKYPAGSKVPTAQIDKWFAADSQSAWDRAVKLAKAIGEPCLAQGFYGVNYQLGNFWCRKHKNTWRYLANAQWQKARDEVRKSKWYDTTPKRVADFQKVLDGLIARKRQDETWEIKPSAMTAC